MKNNDYSDYDSLNRMAEKLGYSKERSLLREKAMNIADTLNDERKQFDARITYVNDVCMEGSFPEKYLAVFPWLLAYAGKSKSGFDKMQVLWYYKWVITLMPEFPTVSKRQIEAALDDLRVKYREYGSTDKVFHDYSREINILMGDLDKSTVHHQQHIAFKRKDKLDDCDACVVNRVVYYHIATGNIEEALKKAKIIFNGKKNCTHVPKDTYANFIVPFLIRKEYDKAEEFSENLEAELKKVKHGANYKAACPLMLNHLVHKRTANAVKLFDKYFANAFDAKAMDGKFRFYVAGAALFTNIERETIKLKLSKNFPHYNTQNTYNVKFLTDWLDTESGKIAALFDKRNGNDKYKSDKASFLSLLS
ncbi:MAG: hypothetical protein QM791_09305 [Ferruginibacter sp.]